MTATKSGLNVASRDGAIRLLIAEDHAPLREALRLILSRQSDFVVVGEAADGLEAVALARSLVPHVIIMDLAMPKMDGVEAIRIIKAENPAILIIGISIYGDGRMKAMLDAGASRVLTKECPVNEITTQIRELMA